MYKFKFTDVLKYAFLKTVLTNILVVITSAFNNESNQQMIEFAIIVGILSLLIIYLGLLMKRKVEFKNTYYIYFLIILLLVVNEITGMVIEKDTNIAAVIMNGKSWQIAYKICDVVSVILSSYLCFILPIRNMRLKSKS